MLKWLLSVLAVCMSASASAQTFPVQIIRHINTLWVDASDVILDFSVTGPCGSIAYIVHRSATNFQEMNAILLTAGASGKSVVLEISGCSADRNIVDHGAVIF